MLECRQWVNGLVLARDKVPRKQGLNLAGSYPQKEGGVGVVKMIRPQTGAIPDGIRQELLHAADLTATNRGCASLLSRPSATPRNARPKACSRGRGGKY